jgi:hypothetical protein
MYSESRTKYASGIYSSLIVGVLVIAGGALAHSPQDDPIVNSFQKCISDFMASYQTNGHEHVTKLGGGWVKEIYRPIGEPSLDIKRTDSIMSPGYSGACRSHIPRSNRSSVPRQTDHAFRGMPISRSEVKPIRKLRLSE